VVGAVFLSWRRHPAAQPIKLSRNQKFVREWVSRVLRVIIARFGATCTLREIEKNLLAVIYQILVFMDQKIHASRIQEIIYDGLN
jgi:hypothetical protein